MLLKNFFQRTPYRIEREGHAVYVKWFKPIEKWSSKANDKYLPTLQKYVKASVNEETWAMIGAENPSSNIACQAYVEQVRTELIEEYSLDGVEIGAYHMGMLVLSFPTSEPESYPYYYRGIQLKPFDPKRSQDRPKANGALV